MTTAQPTLYLLTGCTAVGKTEWALRWAETQRAEIVSCDSLLFYRGMDIGTAKPTPAELARVPHHLIDLNSVDEPLNIARYVEQAQATVADILQRGHKVLVTGGSGFYLKAFLGPVADDVAIAAELRADIEMRLTKQGLATLVDELHRLNPGGLGKLDVHNPRRVVRALERCLATGRPVLELLAEFQNRPGPFADYPVKLTQIERKRPELDERMAARVKAMLNAGLVDEVQRLRSLGLERNPSAARAIGYRETLAYLDGEMTLAELGPAIIANTRALVKKQTTWFRTQIPEHRVVPAGDVTVETLFG